MIFFNFQTQLWLQECSKAKTIGGVGFDFYKQYPIVPQKLLSGGEGGSM